MREKVVQIAAFMTQGIQSFLQHVESKPLSVYSITTKTVVETTIKTKTNLVITIRIR